MSAEIKQGQEGLRLPAYYQVILIADYGVGDPAFTEVKARLRGGLTEQNVEINEHSVSPFATLETGFWIAQIGLENAHPGLVIFSNTAPRGEAAWQGDEKQPFVFVELDTGVPVFAVNAGYTLSFIKDRTKRMVRLDVQNGGTQFRSRDNYPQIVAAYIKGDRSILSGEPINPDTIPDVPTNAVAAVDGYGNLKTTIRKSSVGDKLRKSMFVEVRFNGNKHFALNTLYGVQGKTGQLCVNVGSSGGQDHFLEIVRLQKSAADDFGIARLHDNLGPVAIEPATNVIFANAYR